MRNGAILVGAVVCAGAYLLVGCVGELVSIAPNGTDMNVTPMGDMAMPPAPQEMGDGKVHFFPDIQQDLVTLGCTASGSCHGGTQVPNFLQTPTTQMQKDQNYMNFTSECNTTNPPMSPIIQNALGNMSHGGGMLMKMTDPQYQRWIDWITAGELE
jgi:hypothetical protein